MELFHRKSAIGFKTEIMNCFKTGIMQSENRILLWLFFGKNQSVLFFRYYILFWLSFSQFLSIQSLFNPFFIWLFISSFFFHIHFIRCSTSHKLLFIFFFLHFVVEQKIEIFNSPKLCRGTILHHELTFENYLHPILTWY